MSRLETRSVASDVMDSLRVFSLEGVQERGERIAENRKRKAENAFKSAVVQEVSLTRSTDGVFSGERVDFTRCL